MLRKPLTSVGPVPSPGELVHRPGDSAASGDAAYRTSTIPESPETIAAQVQWLCDGKRAAVLLTPGEALPDIPIGVRLVSTPIGVFIYNPDLLNERLIFQAIRTGEVGLL